MPPTIIMESLSLSFGRDIVMRSNHCHRLCHAGILSRIVVVVGAKIESAWYISGRYCARLERVIEN